MSKAIGGPSPPVAECDALVVDCHSDVMIDVLRRRREGESNVLESTHLPRLRKGGVAAAVCTVGGDAETLCPLGTERPFQSALLVLDQLQRDVEEGTGKIGIARSHRELRTMVENGVFAVVPSLEGASAVDDEPGRLRALFSRGVRCVGLTWNNRNRLATGLGQEDAGLTSVGRVAVGEMNRLGILIDVTHLGAESFWDVLDCTSSPVMASHSNARALHDHPRNLEDDQLDALAAVRGLVGVVFYPDFVGERPVTIEDVLDHVEYLVERMGVHHVGIGADFIDYAVKEIAAELYGEGADYDPEIFSYPDGIEDCRRMGNLVKGLERRGFSAREIRLIAGRNFLRLLSEVEEAGG